MKLDDISKNNKDVVDYSNKWRTWDSWDWHSPSYRFEYISRRGRYVNLHIYKKSLEPKIDRLGTVYYNSEKTIDCGTVTIGIDESKIENIANYRDLMGLYSWHLKKSADHFCDIKGL